MEKRTPSNTTATWMQNNRKKMSVHLRCVLHWQKTSFCNVKGHTIIHHDVIMDLTSGGSVEEGRDIVSKTCRDVSFPCSICRITNTVHTRWVRVPLTICLRSFSPNRGSRRLWTNCWAGVLAMARSRPLFWLCWAMSDKPTANSFMPWPLASAAAAITSGLRGWSTPSVISTTTLTLSAGVSCTSSCVAFAMA